MSRKPRQNEWHRVKGGTWARTLGERGLSVRLFENEDSGIFYRTVRIQGERFPPHSLFTRNREEADRLGEQTLAGLLQGEKVLRSGKVTLERLWGVYSTKNPAYLDNKPSSKKGAACSAKVLMGFFGPLCDVATLTANDQAAFVTARRHGGIVVSDEVTTQPVRLRTVEMDLAQLHMMLRWATTYRLPNGERLLDRHPLDGVRRPREKNQRRPVATWTRYQQTRNALQDLAGATEKPLERLRWIKMELALVLAVATGRRLNSIRQLRWEDVDLAHGEIRWRAETDKEGYEDIIPVPESLITELKRFQRSLQAVGGWVFAGERKPTQPMDRHLFDKWLTVAERKAELPKLRGGLWHPYRRMWATARKHLPVKDVAAAGGWRDHDTLLKCYQQPDRRTILAVMESAMRVEAVGGNG